MIDGNVVLIKQAQKDICCDIFSVIRYCSRIQLIITYRFNWSGLTSAGASAINHQLTHDAAGILHNKFWLLIYIKVYTINYA